MPSTRNTEATITFILDRLDRGKQLTGTELRSLRSCFAVMQAALTSARTAAAEGTRAEGHGDGLDLGDEQAAVTPAPATVPTVFGRPFVLQRDVDHTGVSGIGTVADGVEFPDGTAVVRWRGEHASTVAWASLADALHVHGHAGATRIVWATASTDLGPCAICGGSPVVYRKRDDSLICHDCVRCTCGETPCARTGVRDPAVSAEAADRS